jgi:maltodextrin utilization protein YvdJ
MKRQTRQKILYALIVGSVAVIVLNFFEKKFDAMNIMSIVLCGMAIIISILFLFTLRKKRDGSI